MAVEISKTMAFLKDKRTEAVVINKHTNPAVYAARTNQLEALKAFAGTLVLYESPYRIEKLLVELGEVFPERQVVLARELTKKFEEFLRGKPAELLAMAKKRSLKGEFVVMVGPTM